MSDITFPDAVTLPDGKPAITCESEPMKGVKVKIGPLAGVQIGAVLKLLWLGRNDQGVSLPGTETSLNHFVTPDTVKEGVELTIKDYERHIKPIRDGSAEVGYTINGGSSTSVVLAVFLLNADNQTCDEAGTSRG